MRVKTIHMKKLYPLLALALTVLTSNAQIVNIPNATFRTKLLAANQYNSIAVNNLGQSIKIDANSDGQIQESEALAVYELRVNNSNISNLTGIESFTNLRYLDCGQNQLSSLNVTSLTNLNQLFCRINQLSSLNVSNMPNLKVLNCYQNLLTSLTITNDFLLEELYISENQIQSIDLTSFINLKNLWIGNNPYTSPINLNPLVNLENLSIEDITNPAMIPLNDSNMPLFVNLTQLSTNNSVGISNLHYNLIPNLEILACQNTGLTSLDFIPTDLKVFNCPVNNLTSMNLTQFQDLEFLTIGQNPIASITFGNHPNLHSISASQIPLTDFDVSGLPALNWLSLSFNPTLNSLNIKNGIPTTCYLMGCPNLNYICTDDNELTTIQNTITQFGYTNCQVNSYCSFTPGGDFYTIQGNNRYDIDNTGCDDNDINYPSLKLAFTNGTTSGNLIANASGSYSIPVLAATHSITPLVENPNYFTVSPPTTTVTFPTATSPFIRDFCITANGTHNDLEVALFPIGPARPGFDAHYKIIYKNKGTHIQNGTINLWYPDVVVDFISANPTISGTGSNTLNWDFANLQPFETREISFTVNINSPVETPPVLAGNILYYVATAIGATDETPDDNTSTLMQSVVNSFDPNDKTCVEGQNLPIDRVGQYVHYIIRFENTGTFAAENIVVKDIIDTTKFDIATLVPLSGSHPFVTRVINTNQVEFIFENINLPFDDANNDGYVAFKIKTKPTLVPGNTFSNSASIYFDYNAPIVTDTYSTTVYNPLSNDNFNFNSDFSLSPVPTKNTLTITSKETISISSISIYNTLGQLVQVNTNPNETIDVSALQSGSYFIKIISDKGSTTGKFIKE